MNLQTVAYVSKELDIPQAVIRKAVAERKLPALKLGNRMLVDMDTAQEILHELKPGATMQDVCEATGLKECAILRGMKEGWIPYERPGKTYVFDLDRVMDSIRKKMEDIYSEYREYRR